MRNVRVPVLLCVVLAVGGQLIAAEAPPPKRPPLPNQMPGTNELAQYRNEVETLRGKKFLHEVPTRLVSEKEVRELVQREIEKTYPGRKLTDLQELLAWLGVVPSDMDLVSVCENLMVDQAAGLYDSETKTMCIPSFQSTNHPAENNPQSASQKKQDAIPDALGGLVFTHEYTHALEDQYWPMDDPAKDGIEDSTDTSEAHSFLLEGSATRLMVETAPAEFARKGAGDYRVIWTLLHSGLGEMVIKYALGEVWKSPEAKVAGVPEALSRAQVMPYSFGYAFCTRMMRDWGLDGLDYLYEHRPISTEQVMHPKKAWDWRDFPVEIALPESFPGGWNRLIDDTIGEAGTAVLLGTQLKNLERGVRLASGWDGDRVALYERPDGKRLLAWVSAWDSTVAAERFARACVEERRLAHQAEFTKNRGQRFAWRRPDGRAGTLYRYGTHVVLLETDQPAALDQESAWARSVTFTQSPEEAARAAANHGWLRFNPVLAWRKDGDYSITRAVAGLLWRHDQNSVGTADRALWGIVGECRGTASFSHWQLGWGLVAKHDSEARRGATKTTVLPWGLLGSHSSALLPYAPTNRIYRTAAVWGLAATSKTDAGGRHLVTILPGGLLLQSMNGPGIKARHVLGTGITHRYSAKDGAGVTRFHLLGITVWSSQTSVKPGTRRTKLKPQERS
jgi:hypothetical protein